MRFLLPVVLVITFFTNVYSGSVESEKQKMSKLLHEKFQNVQIKELENRQPFKFVWEVSFSQLLDHQNPSLGSFHQRFILYHRSFKSPTVFVTEGYDVKDKMYEATKLLNANQLAVEYRFNGQSKPEVMNWRFLNLQQALDDLHSIRSNFKSIYKKTWLCTGISKGGTTTAAYATLFPDDVKAAISYVGPFPRAQEDKRTIEHYKNKVATASCRNQIFLFQKNLLKHRDEIIPLLEKLSQTDNVSFPLGYNATIDYAAVEYPFSFWQWGFNCKDIPSESASAEDIYDHIEAVVDFNFYDNKSFEKNYPSFYEFLTEYGYYGFDTTGLSQWLTTKSLSNLNFCPPNTDLSYKPSYMAQLTEKIQNSGNHILYIYGANDTWTSCAIEPNPTCDALKIIKEGGSHITRIRNLNAEEKAIVYKTLHKWTKLKINPILE